MTLFGADLVVEFGNRGLAGHVCLDWDDLAFNVLAELLGNCVELLLSASGDVDFGAVDGTGEDVSGWPAYKEGWYLQSLCDHQTNSRA